MYLIRSSQPSSRKVNSSTDWTICVVEWLVVGSIQNPAVRKEVDSTPDGGGNSIKGKSSILDKNCFPRNKVRSEGTPIVVSMSREEFTENI